MTKGRSDRYEDLRDKAKEMACLIKAMTPSGGEQSLALAILEILVFWAGAGIARNE